MTAFNLEILTPAGKILTEEVASVKIPAENGQIQILDKHTNYVGLLGTGIVEYALSQGNSKRLVVSGGFVNFLNNTVSILCDEAVLPDTVNPKYDEERTSLQASLKDKSLDSAEAIRTKQKLALISAVDALVSN
jgi:F-type H+-transporting ATPase subunit epsilon